MKEFIDLATSATMPRKAFFTACIVGTILTAINRLDTIILGEIPPTIKNVLTYCVPYYVTTCGSVLCKKSRS